MKRYSFLSSLIFVFLLTLSTTFAAIPYVISYQGNILDETQGKPLNGAYSMTFELFEQPTGGTPIWTVNQSVTVENGYFNVYLGDINPLNNVNFNKPLWLQVTVANGTPYPRTRLGAVPYAIQTQQATLSDTALIAKDIVDGVLTWQKFQPNEIIAGGDLTGTYPDPTLAPGAALRNLTPGSITQEYLSPNIAFPPSGKAGGDLSGQYPDPVIAKGAVKTDRIFDGAVTHEKLASDAISSINIEDGSIMLADLNNEVKMMGGDLSGMLPNPTVVGFQGIPVSNTTPLSGEIYMFNGTQWVPAQANGDVAGTYDNLQIQPGVVGSAEITDGSITDVDISATAAIQGTKIVPDFGAQNIITTGDLTVNNGTFNGITATSGTFTDLTVTNPIVGSMIGNLSNGAGIATFTYNGSANAVVSANVDGTTIGTNVSGALFLMDGAVSNIKLASDAVTTDKILNATIMPVDVNLTAAGWNFDILKQGGNNVLTEATSFAGDVSGLWNNLQLGPNVVGSTELADNAVTTNKILNGAVTPAKIQPSATDDYVLKTVGGNVTWAPDDFTIPIDKLYAVNGDMFKLTRTAGTGSVIVGINNGTGGNAGRFESTNPDPALVAINYNNTGVALYAEKNTSTANQYVAEIINSNINLGRSLNVQNNSPYPTGWVIGSLDPTDVVEATVVVKNNNGDPNKPAIKTYGDIIANSNVVASEFYAVNQITVGDVNTGLFTTITPPTVLGGSIDINSGANIHGDLFVNGDITATGTITIPTAIFDDITVNNTATINNALVTNLTTDYATVNNDLTVSGLTDLQDVNVTGTMDFNTGNIIFDGTTGDGYFANDLLVGNDITVGNDLYVTNNVTAVNGIYSGDVSAATFTGGDYTGGNATFTGDVTAVNGIYSGDVSATTFTGGDYTGGNATLTGDVTAVNGVYSGDVSAATFTGGSFTGTTGAFNGDVMVDDGTGTFDNPTANPDLYVLGNIEADGTIYGTLAGPLVGVLSEGPGISAFTYDGSANATVEFDYGYANTWTALQTFNGGLAGTNGAFSGDVSAATFTGGDYTGGNATFTGDVTAVNGIYSGDVSAATFTGGDYTGGNATFTGDVSADNGIFTSDVSAATFTGGDYTGGNATFTGDVTAVNGIYSGDVSAATFTGGDYTGGNATFTGDVSADNGIFTSDVSAATFTGGDYTGGNATFTGDVSAATFTGGDYTGGNATFTGNVSALSFTQNGNAVLDAATTFANALTSDATVTGTYNSLDIQLNAGVVGTTEIDDATEFALFTADDANTISLTDGSHSMTIAGGTNVTTSIAGNTLTIDASVLTDGSTMLGDGTVGNEIRINLANPNTWTGTQTFSAVGNGLVVTTGADFQGAIANSLGDLNFNDNIIVTGTSDLRGAISNSTGNVLVNDNLVVTGTSNLQGAVTANNGVTITAGGLTVQNGGANITGGVNVATGDLNMATGNIYAGDGTLNLTSNTEIGNAGSRKDLTVYGSTILGYQTAGSLAVLNGLTNVTVVGYTGAGPVALSDLPAAAVNGQILYLVNLTGGLLNVDAAILGVDQMMTFVYAAGAWHILP